MTDRDRTPHNAASWVDEVLKPAAPAPTPQPETVLSGPEDLKLPGDVGSQRVSHSPGQQTDAPWSADDWVARATGGQPLISAPVPAPQARPPADTTSATVYAAAPQPVRTAGPLSPPAPAAWDEPHTAAAASAAATLRPLPLAEDIGQKKLIAGLLAIFLGALGVHKFYLGLTGPGLVLLGVNIGVWLIAFMLGVMLMFVGLAFTLPMASFVSGVLSLIGLIEGIIYLTKSDAEFERDYLVEKKPWF